MRRGTRATLGAIALIVAALAAPCFAQAVGTAAATPITAIDDGPRLPRESSSGPTPLFELLGVKWKSRTIRYFNKARVYSDDVRQAAAAWNGSGARLKWKAVSKKRAAVVITPSLSRNSPFSGLASTNGKRGSIQLQPNLYDLADDPEGGSLLAQTVIVHEMGHIIGLDHEDGVCAAMNSSPLASCDGPPEIWQYRCRALHPDDVRGAIRLFGGKARDLGAEFCGDAVAPAPVENLTATYYAHSDTVGLEWTLPAQNPPDDVFPWAGVPPGSCPVENRLEETGYKIRGGLDFGVDEEPDRGVNCYAVVGQSVEGRRGPAVYVSVTVP